MPDELARSSASTSAPVCRCGSEAGVERYLDLMQHDKKVQDGKLRLVLLQQARAGGTHRCGTAGRSPPGDRRALRAC
jgi:3-dehydroquinate synthetase